jgi:hypothetical protein
MPSSRGGFWRKALTLTSYAAAGAVIAFWTAYWPASAGNILTKLSVTSNDLMPVSDASSQVLKAERLPAATFEERWDALPSPHGAKGGERASQHEAPQSGERAEKIPFSCEMAFSRLVTHGNFSTRCIASLDTLTTVIAAV